MEENQREVEEIKLEIYQVRQKRQDLENRMPECVQVSMFDIQCKDILVYMLEKYEQLEKNLLNLISKRYRESNRVLSNQFEQITHKLKEQPEDIEALTELKEYM
jgi:dynein heavy chain